MKKSKIIFFLISLCTLSLIFTSCGKKVEKPNTLTQETFKTSVESLNYAIIDYTNESNDKMNDYLTNKDALSQKEGKYDTKKDKLYQAHYCVNIPKDSFTTGIEYTALCDDYVAKTGFEAIKQGYKGMLTNKEYAKNYEKYEISGKTDAGTEVVGIIERNDNVVLVAQTIPAHTDELKALLDKLGYTTDFLD